MKKVLLSVIALASFTVATAQDGLKGAWWASCQVGMQKSENGKAESTNTTILPLAGYFVSPSVTVGAAVGMINVDTKNVVATGIDLESKLIVVQPLVRKYWNVNGGLFFFGQLATPIITGTSEFNTTALKDVKVSQFGATMSGGFDYVVNKWFTVEFHSYPSIKHLQIATLPLFLLGESECHLTNSCLPMPIVFIFKMYSSAVHRLFPAHILRPDAPAAVAHHRVAAAVVQLQHLQLVRHRPAEGAAQFRFAHARALLRFFSSPHRSIISSKKQLKPKPKKLLMNFTKFNRVKNREV